jgi:hypothetical protein
MEPYIAHKKEVSDSVKKYDAKGLERELKQKLHWTGSEYVNMLVLKIVEKYLLVDVTVVTTDQNGKFLQFGCI